MNQLKRWHGVIIDPITQEEFAKKMNGFLKCDFDYCLNTLAHELKNKYKLYLIDVYRLCKESKLCRLKEDGYKEMQLMRSQPVNKEGREKVKMYLSKITKLFKKTNKG